MFNGNSLQTYYVSTTEIACLIGPGDTIINGLRNFLALDEDKKWGSETIEVYVRNIPPGGGDSNLVNFVIHSNHTFAGPINTGASTSAVYPDIAVDGSGYLYILYGDIIGNSRGIHFQRSTNRGKT